MRTKSRVGCRVFPILQAQLGIVMFKGEISTSNWRSVAIGEQFGSHGHSEVK